MFQVQKSSDGHKFSTIGSLPSLGDGTHNYSFTDPHLYNSGSLYRIAEIAKDGNLTDSKIISVDATNLAAVTIFTIPARNSITIVVPGSLLNSNALIFNISGGLVKRVHLSGLSTKIPVQSLATGI